MKYLSTISLEVDFFFSSIMAQTPLYNNLVKQLIFLDFYIVYSLSWRITVLLRGH